jgi:hypothetical protein
MIVNIRLEWIIFDEYALHRQPYHIVFRRTTLSVCSCIHALHQYYRSFNLVLSLMPDFAIIALLVINR